MKIFLADDVLVAAKKRIRWVFEEFEHVAVNTSGGKDSTVVLELSLQVAEEMGRLPLKVMFVDQEAAIVQAAFAGTGPVWQPNTLFGSATGLLFHPTITPGYCIPNPTNGFVYSGYGTTGSTQPTFPTVIGQTSTGDGYVTGWTCVAATGQAGAVLPFDQTLNSVITLNLRYSAAQQLASGNSALLSLLTTAQAGWATALAAQPAQNGSQDNTSFVVTQVLQNFIGQAQTWLAAESFQ